MKNLTDILCLLICMALLAPSSVSADIYKWSDAQGNVHYSENPPIDRDVEVIKSAPKVDAGAPENLQRQLFQAEKSRLEREYKRDKKEKIEEYKKVKQQRCQDTQARMEKLQNSRQVRVMDHNGNVTRSTEEEHQTRIKYVQSLVARWCN